jgi:hypothetical protein
MSTMLFGGHPNWLPLIANAIPADLRGLGWVLWRAEDRGGDKPTKVPYCVADPSRKASSTDQSTWATFADACEASAAVGDVAGIGVVLTMTAGISCIDLDHVLVGKELDVRAQTILERCDSWTEISPSGTGLHVFVRGSVSKALKGPQIEVYSTARYIAVTGHQWPGTPSDLRPQQAYLDHLVVVAHDADRPRRPWTGPAAPPPDDLVGALLAKLQTWGIPAARVKRWSDGYLVELAECPWADEHTTGLGGAAVMIHASGAFDFVCLHAHCAGRDWRDFRAVMERQA